MIIIDRMIKGVFSLALLLLFVNKTSYAQSPYDNILWSTVAPQPFTVNEAQGKVVNGKLYTFGGFDVTKAPNFTPTKRAYVYDPVANTWTPIADLPFTPNGTNFGGVTHAGITTDGSNIYFAGGYTSNTAGTGQIFGTNQAWKYNVSSNTYTALPNLPYATSAAQMEFLDNKLHLIGGTNPARTDDLGDHLVLDLNNLAGGWTTLAPLPNPRHHGGSATVDGKIYFIGGQHDHDGALVTQNDMHVYNPASNSWTQVADLPSPAGTTGRGHITSSTIVVDGKIIVLAGETSSGVSTNMVSLYTPGSDSWTNLTPLPANRYSGVAAYINGNIFYTGGSSSATTYSGVPVRTGSFKVNFQNDATTTPAGWLKDFGQAYGARTSASQGTGNTYGWLRASNNTPLDITPNGRNRNTPSDVLLATLMHMQGNHVANFSGVAIEALWETQIANGNYEVTVSVGDGSQVDSRHFINAEGVSAITDFVPTTTSRFKNATVPVTVSDGKLTIDATGGTNTKINYVIAYPVSVTPLESLAFNPGSLNFTVVQNGSTSSQQSTLSASAGTPNITLQKSANSNWLVLPSNPATGALSFGINSSGVAPGNYNATVTASASGYTSAVLNVSLTVDPDPSLTTITILPLEDAYTRKSVPTTNFGSADSLVTKTTPGGSYNRNSYLKFSLAGVQSVSSAKLRIYGRNLENSTNIIISAFGVSNDAWTESGINWNNAPAGSGSVLSTAGINNVAKYYEFDVTSFITAELGGDKVASILLTDVAIQEKLISFNSRENTNKPELIILGTSSGPSLSFTPASLSFIVDENGTTPSQQSTLAASSGTPAVSLAKSANSDWLILPASPTPGSLDFGINSASLAPGTYSSTVTASATGYADAQLNVSLQVNPDNPPVLSLSFNPTSLTFGVQENGTAPAQNSAISASEGTPSVTFSKSANSNWLVLPSSPALGSNAFNINANGLAPGNYSATVTASATGYTDATLQVDLSVQGGSPNETILSPLADAYTRKSVPSTNFGNADSLVVKTTPGGNFNRNTYLRFSLASIENVTGAKLRLYGSNLENSTTINASVFGVTDDSWTETGINWNNAPVASGSALTVVGVNNVEKYYEFDVSNFVIAQFGGDKMVSLVVTDVAIQEKLLSFNSKENSQNPPQLVITNNLAGNSLSFNPDILAFSVVQNGSTTSQSSVLSASTGTPSVTLTKSANSAWLILPANPTIGSLDFGINATGLAPGTYTSTVTASANSYSPADLTVELQVTGDPGSPSIVFVQTARSVEVEQGNTIDILEYVAATDSTPVSVQLNSTGADGNVPNWLFVGNSLVDGIAFTAGSEITFHVDATNLSIGTYTARIIASAAGYNNALLDITLDVKSGGTGVLTDIQVNFQDAATIPPAGWIRDFGQAFGPRTSANQGTNNVYGWIKRTDGTPVDLTLNGRKRTSPSDLLLATLMHMQGNHVPNFSGTPIEGVWEAQVPNGVYDVTVSVGDGTQTDSRHNIAVEDVPAIVNFVPTTSNRFKFATISVSVNDGLLTVDADGGQNTKINYIIIKPSTTRRPSVVAVSPENGSTNVSDNTSISTLILNLPNGGINNTTINGTNVYLTEEGDDATHIPANVNGTGGGDAITLVPSSPLKLSTRYNFHITDGVKDLSGASFIPYTSSFTTGSVSTISIIGAKFIKTNLSNTTGRYSSLTIGPDGKLYALSIDGIIKRFTINSNGTLQNPELIFSLQDAYGPRQERLAIGFAFAPNATAQNLVAYVTHSTFVFIGAPDWDGKLTRLSGPSLGTVQDILINLPRSSKDHLSNSIAFGPDGHLYFTQGSNSAMGEADQTWGNRDEHLLSGAVLKLDLSKLTTLPLNVKTSNGGNYNPYPTNAPLRIYASGVRNAYDLLWHTNGQLYVPTNGSAAGGNTPSSVNGVLRPDGTTYNGPTITGLNGVQQTQKDFLYRVEQGGYYGHPNPTRGEFVMNGGNPTSQIDPAQVDGYPVGTQPDVNYRGFAFDFQTNKSPNGIIEYRSNSFNGVLKGKLMVVRYSQNDDIITLTPGGSSLNIISYNEGASIQGFSGFNDPLDLVEDRNTGNIYVSNYGGDGPITLLKPEVGPTEEIGTISVNPDTLYFSQQVPTGVSPTQGITIKNVGDGTLTITGITKSGTHQAEFSLLNLPSLPFNIAVNDSIVIDVNFNPNALGIRVASVSIASNDTTHPSKTVVLRGLGTNGLGGSNEPSLQMILNLYNLPINVGDDDVNTTVIHSNAQTQAAPLLGDEISIQSFVKAGSGNVTIEPLAVFGPTSTDPVLRMGWYTSGNAASLQEMLTVSNNPVSNGQTVDVIFNGSLNFDPGTGKFGFYTIWPFFSNRQVFSEDNLNTFTGSAPHHVRVYPYKTSAGVIENTYLVVFEEHITALDYQDFVFIVRNVKNGNVANITQSPIEDSYVRGGSFANQNFGLQTTLAVKTSNSSPEVTRSSYLKFNLGMFSDIQSAKLRIYGRNTENSINTNLSLFGVANDGWTETGITFNNAPAQSGTALQTFSVDDINQYYELDVTAYVQAQFDKDKIASFVIKDVSNQNRTIEFNSRENGTNKPELVITTSGIKPKSNAMLFVENRDKFPSNDYFVTSRIHIPWTRDTEEPKLYNSNHDTVKIRMHNKGVSNLVITNFVRSNNVNWKFLALKGLAYDSLTAFPLVITPGTFADLTLHFEESEDLNTRIKQFNDNLVIISNDDAQPAKSLTLVGVWQREGEGSKEPRTQEMITAFGFLTRTGFVATDPDQGNASKPKGDEILSSYFVRADATKPVYVIQMAAYHQCCRQAELLKWYPKGQPTVLNGIVPHIIEDGQTLLPRRNSTKVPAEGSVSPTVAFGLKVGGMDFTDTLLNPQRKIGVRIWKAIDKSGKVIPNEYIIANDYLGTEFTNYDYNDNLYYIKNIKPEIGANHTSLLSATPSAVDFNELTAGSSASLNVSLQNSGITYGNGTSDPPITISSVEIVGENRTEFSVENPSQSTLNAQGSTTMSVTFNPSSQGLKIADLLVHYNFGTLRVPLYGIAKNANSTVVVHNRIKSGSTTPVSVNGKTWSAETGFAFDNLEPYTNPNLTSINATDEDVLYLREQSSNGDKKPFRYQISLPNGNYHVRLHFAEIFWGAPGSGVTGGPGSRVMSVALENQQRLINLDVAAEVGTASALIKNLPVTVTDGALNINFTASVNRPMVCAVEVYSFSSGAAATLEPAVSMTESVTNNQLEKPAIYPNPVKNHFNISIPAAYHGKLNLSISDARGRMFELGKYYLQYGGSTFQVDVSRLALRPGVYYLRMTFDKHKAEIVKLVVQ